MPLNECNSDVIHLRDDQPPDVDDGTLATHPKFNKTKQ